jgi:hypothetical protein
MRGTAWGKRASRLTDKKPTPGRNTWGEWEELRNPVVHQLVGLYQLASLDRVKKLRKLFAKGSFCYTLVAQRAQKRLVLLRGVSNRIIAGCHNPGCLRKLFCKPYLNTLPEFLQVRIVNQRMGAKPLPQETLPNFQYVVLVVVPGLGIANFHFPHTFLLGGTKRFTDGLAHICNLPGLFVEANRQGEDWLKHVGMQHHVGAGSASRRNRADILLRLPQEFI